MILQLTVPFILFSRHVQLQTVTSLTTHAHCVYCYIHTVRAQRYVHFTRPMWTQLNSSIDRFTLEGRTESPPSFHNSLLCDLVSGHVQVSNWCIDSQPHVMEYVSLKLNSTTRTRHGPDNVRGLCPCPVRVGSVSGSCPCPCSGI